MNLSDQQIAMVVDQNQETLAHCYEALAFSMLMMGTGVQHADDGH